MDHSKMSDSEGESSSDSLAIDHMSVSDQEIDGSREDDMPSAEVDLPLNNSNRGDSNNGDSSRGDGDSLTDSSVSEEDHNMSMKTAANHCIGDSQPNEAVVKQHDTSVDLMSASYSEITTPPQYETDPKIDKLAMEGTLMKDGNMVHFIAKNLETKIRLSSPEVSDPSSVLRSPPENQVPVTYLDPTCLLLLEREARNIATSVDGLTEHLAVSLHTISAVTAESLSVYRDSVCKTCDAMDGNIKSMYQLMAKCEELSKAMAPLYKQAEQVKEIKKLLDIMENI